MSVLESPGRKVIVDDAAPEVGLKVVEHSTNFPAPADSEMHSKTRVLFARHGVQLDRLGRDEVTPEVFARFTAQLLLWDLRRPLGRLRQDLDGTTPQRRRVLEVCSGLGGNTIQFALHGAAVDAVEIDAARISKAKKNAKIYQVPEDSITYFNADFLDANDFPDPPSSPADGHPPSPPYDCVFLSPPWGGKTQMRDFRLLEKPLIVDLFRRACAFADVVAIYLPKAVTISELTSLPLRTSGDSPFGELQVERLLFNGKPKATLAIFRRGLCAQLPRSTDLPELLTSSRPSSELFWRQFADLGYLGRLCRDFRTRLLRFT